MGRLCRDPEVRYGQQNDTVVARYTLAIDRRYKKDGDEQTADFLPCVVFNKGAEFAEKYLHKGTKIVVEGHLQTGSYTNKDGVKVYTTDVIVEQQEFAESKSAEQPAATAQPQADSDGFMNIPDGMEDLPFN